MDVKDHNLNCEYMEGCVFFNTISNESTIGNLKTLYCKGYWKDCIRWKMRSGGEEVPPELWPNGEMPK